MELENEELEKLYAESFHGIQVGSILSGKVLSIKPDGVIVDVGYKSEGLVPGSEFSEAEISRLREGDSIDVFVEHIVDAEGMLVLSRERASRIKAWSVIESSQKDDSPLEGVVVGKTRGGVFVDISGVRAFMPGSHMDIRPIKDIDSLIGQRVMVKVLKTNNKRTNVVVSRKMHLEEERLKKKSETMKILAEGAVMEGVIKNITDYGVFVDLGGVDGLLHISDISWGRITHPAKLFTVGAEIEVVVLKFDAETEKVTLGYKQKKPDPWGEVEAKYPQGTKVQGKVVSVTDYGAFIEVEEALEGLVHVTEMDWAPKPKHPSKYLSVGETVEAFVLKASTSERKLSLSIRQLKPSPWKLVSEHYRVGQAITGKVRGLTEFGAFIGLPEGVDGLVHISDMSWTRHIKHPSEMLKKGQTVQAVILGIEPEKERMSLGIRQAVPDPWRDEITKNFRLGEELKCRVLRVTDFGAFVELRDDVEGLIYSSEMLRTDEPLKEGDEVWARIIKIDLENRKIGLSMKNVHGELE